MRLSSREWFGAGLSVVGALNWGLIGLFGFNLVHTLFGWSRPIERLVYTTVGLAGLIFALSITRFGGTAPQMQAQAEERRPIGVV